MSKFTDRELTFYATCPTGLEDLLQKEVQETFSETILPETVKYDSVRSKGKVFFTLKNSSELHKIHLLRIAGHIVWVVYENHDIDWQNRVEIDEKLKKIVDESIDYDFIKAIWEKNILNQLSSKMSNEEFEREKKYLESKRYVDKKYGLTGKGMELSGIEKKAVERHLRTHKNGESAWYETDRENRPFLYKLETDRFGKKQKIDSMENSIAMGGWIQDASGWPFSMKKPTLEMKAYIGEEKYFRMGVQMTTHSGGLFWRNILYFGKTPLKMTICAAMIKLADIQPGEVLYDPMCGVGSIPIEAASTETLNPLCLSIGSDNWEKSIESFRDNCRTFERAKAKLNSIQMANMDATNLPFRNGTVDVIITDMPFGKRIGTKELNRELYGTFLTELGRVTKCGNGRAVLLTSDRQAMSNAVSSKVNVGLWKQVHSRMINHGNLRTKVYLMKRTDSEWGTL